MPLKTETARLQSELAQYCRAKKEDAEVARKDRLHHYRRLVFNNVYNVLETAYPVACEILGRKVFKQLVERFFASHDPKDPQYWKFPFELIAYVSNHESTLMRTFPFLRDLLLFEWAEIDIHVRPNVVHTKNMGSIDSVLSSDQIFKITPYYSILELDYPVHLLRQGKQSLDQEATFILVYRTFEGYDVNYYHLSPYTVILLNLIASAKLSLRELYVELQRISGTSKIQIEEVTPSILKSLTQKQIIKVV